MKLDEDTIKALKAQYGDRLYILSGGGYEVAVTIPSPEAYDRYLAMAASDEERHAAAATLFRDCVVAPDKEQIREILQRKPALATLWGRACSEIAGGNDKIEVKKA